VTPGPVPQEPFRPLSATVSTSSCPTGSDKMPQAADVSFLPVDAENPVHRLHSPAPPFIDLMGRPLRPGIGPSHALPPTSSVRLFPCQPPAPSLEKTTAGVLRAPPLPLPVSAASPPWLSLIPQTQATCPAPARLTGNSFEWPYKRKSAARENTATSAFAFYIHPSYDNNNPPPPHP